MSGLQTFTTTRSSGVIPDTPEKSRYTVTDRSPLDRHFRPDSGGSSQVATLPRLPEIGGNSLFFNTNSIISHVGLVTTPYAEPAAVASPPLPTLPEPPATPDQEQAPTENREEGEDQPPSAFDPSDFNRARSRASQTSGLLSIITLPSFITNDRPRPHSTSAGRQESPIRPQNNHRKLSSILSHRFSGTESALPVSPVYDEDTSGKRSRPTSGALRIITSALKGSGSASSSVRSSSPSSRRSSRRSLGRLKSSLGGEEDEAIVEWNRLPPLPPVQGALPTQTSQSHAVIGVEESLAERVPSHYENESKPPIFLAARTPLPPSPSTLASSASSLTYAPPSPGHIPPINDFATPYFSYPPLPPSISSTPGPLNYPPLPPSVSSTPGSVSYPPLPPSVSSTPGPPSYPATPRSIDISTDSSTVHPTDRIVSLAINTLRRLSDETDRTQSNSNTPTTATQFAFPRNNNNFSPYPPDDDVSGRSIYRGSEVSAHSQFSVAQGFTLPALPLFPLLTIPSSPPLPTGPRGPRPLPPTPGRVNRGETMYSRTSSTGL